MTSELENPYRSPEEPSEAMVATDGIHFYTVSPTKFLVLSIGTFGIYHLYWHWKNWRLQKDHAGAEVIPFMRAIFCVFFTHALVDRVHDQAVEKGIQAPPLRGAATVYVIALIAGRVFDRLSARSEDFTILDGIGFACLFVATFALVPVQKAINKLSSDPEGTTNSRFTALNIMILLICAVLWALILFGFLISTGLMGIDF